jgi:hypothetical protein
MPKAPMNYRFSSPGSSHELGLARTAHIYTVHDGLFGDFRAKNTVYTP